jgi:hypothetical protein
LQPREVQLWIDVECGTHLRDRFGICLAMGELRAQQVMELGIARITGNGGAQSRELGRFHVSGSIAQGFPDRPEVFRGAALCKGWRALVAIRARFRRVPAGIPAGRAIQYQFARDC